MAGPEEMQRREEVSRVKAEHEEDLLKLPNVTGVYTDYKTTGGERTTTISIVVTVREKKDVPRAKAIPKEIDGIPTDVIEEEIVPMMAVLLEEIAPAVDAASYATLEGGISIGPCRSVHLDPPDVPTSGDYVFVGTLGCIVRDNATSQPMMLSNFHVMCVNDAWTVGDTMAQPSRVDGGSCPAGLVGTLARAQLTENVDGAVSSVSGRPTSCSIVDIGDINGTATASAGLAVRKRGRTTTLTHGSVTATDYTTNVDYGDGLGVVTFHNQIRIVNDAAQSAQFGNKGDSGSVVVNAGNEVVGLYFAGNSAGTVGVANPIAAVLAELDVSMCTNVVKKVEHKEFFKEWDWEKTWRAEIKDLEKSRFKDFVKDWKEWAYEKFAAFEHYDPWERFPPEGVRPGPITRPPISGGPGGIGRGGSMEERVARLEATLQATGARAMWEPRVEGNCIDFGGPAPGPGPNPVSAGTFSITLYDHTGAQLPASQVSSWGSHAGLNAAWTLEAKLGSRCPVVQATLVHFAQPAVMEAYDSSGTLVGTATMGPTQNVEQTLTIQGASIAYVRIRSPQNETLLLRLCCCEEVTCKAKESKEGKDWKELPKEIPKEHIKELKEPHKELKEFPKELEKAVKDEPKEFKEFREPKGIKEDKEFREPKGIKEPKEFKEIREGGEVPRMPSGSLEERVAYLESMFGGAHHFIASDARPDLSRGALHYETGSSGGRAPLRHRG